MPLRYDPTLWFNLPGIVAAYQPVRAPDPMLARYNMAHGGDNRYKVFSDVNPTWRAIYGWIFNGYTQYYTTGITPSAGCSGIIRFSNLGASGWKAVFGADYQGTTRFSIDPYDSGRSFYEIAGSELTSIGAGVQSGVLAISGQYGYKDGIIDSTGASAWSGTSSISIDIGRDQQGPAHYADCYVQAAAFYSRTLSTTEIWFASRQMKYCDINSDWSAWGRQRKWYYAPPPELVADLYVGPFQDVVIR